MKNSIQNNKSDFELYNDFLKGNKEAFNIIIQHYRKQLVNFILNYVHNLDTAEDLAQDTFLYMIINKKEYDFKYSLKTYLYTIAKCRAINYLKKSSKITYFDETYMIDLEYEEDIEESVIKNENKKVLQKALRKIKQEYQIAIYLADIQGFKYKEISKILNKTIPQTKMLIYRARKALSKQLKKEGEIC